MDCTPHRRTPFGFERILPALPPFLILLILLLPLRTHASENVPAKPQLKPIALKGATIHPVSGPEIASGTILFDKGRITALGADVPIPKGTDVIDLSGKDI